MADANTPPFLQNNPAVSAGANPAQPPFPSRPQPSGGSNQADGGNDRFPNRPQPMGSPKPNPQSVPNGGPLPYPGPSVPTQTPFKLGK